MAKKKASAQKKIGRQPKNGNASYEYSPEERKLFEKRQKRFQKMYDYKKRLGITQKCNRMDALYTPHLTTIDDQATTIMSNQNFADDKILSEKARKSMPIAFEKITTAVALLIKENPKGVMKPADDKYREMNFFVQNVYYDNFIQQQKKEVLKKYVYHLAKYSIGYWREYIKKTYRKQHYETTDEDGNPITAVKWVYDVFDVVAENVHPNNIILDNNCISLKDVNKPANDLILHQYLTEEEFEAIYPEEKFPNAEFVEEGQAYMFSVDDVEVNQDKHVGDKKKIQVAIYENKFENLRETWANGVPIESIPLPGDELSVQGDKWIFDRDNYDGIGVGQIIELYQPLVDDILNASNEYLRLIVRPNEDWYNGAEVEDESEDVVYGSGNIRRIKGPVGSVTYSTPPDITNTVKNNGEALSTEIDQVSGINRNLGGTDKAKTAYQSAQNREASLQKLSLPMDNIKKTIEDAANLSIKLFQICYSEPTETNIMSPGDDEFDEGVAILEEAEKYGVDDDRAVVMELGEEGQPTKIARRKFRKMELPIKIEAETGEDGQTTTRLVSSEEKNFFEALPKDFQWRGRIEIIGESFLPTSKAIEDEQNKETIEYLMNIPVTDSMGRPVLTDASGRPFIIDKVRLAKDRARMNSNFDPDKYVVPMTAENQGQGMLDNQNPLETPSNITPTDKAGITVPEVNKVIQ